MTALPPVAGLIAVLWFGAAPSPPGVETVRLEPKTRPAVYASPGGRRVDRLADHTPYGSRRASGCGAPGHVAEGRGPECAGRAGWIAERHTLPAPRLVRRIEIDRSSRRLTVINGDQRWSTRVIVGGAASPTPLGTFQVTDRLPGERFHGTYGKWIFALSAYGTPARTSRLAVHGYPPAARSRLWSAGCVRVPGAALRRLAREVPPGTPVRVRA